MRGAQIEIEIIDPGSDRFIYSLSDYRYDMIKSEGAGSC